METHKYFFEEKGIKTRAEPETPQAPGLKANSHLIYCLALAFIYSLV
jgi:hypothetical protein